MAVTQKTGLFCSCRLFFALISMFGMTLLYMLRINASLALVCMVNQTWSEEQNSEDGGECPLNRSKEEIKDGPFQWNQEESMNVIGAFYHGYILLQIPGAILASYIGPKIMITFAIAGSAAVNLATPAAAHLGFWYLYASRIVNGIVQGATFPVMQTMIALWAPPEERSMLTALVYTGFQLGPIVTFVTCGYLCKHVGWESIFYIFGGLGILWSTVWIAFIGDGPGDTACISKAERKYIVESLVGTSKEATLCKVPWLKIALSIPVWSLVVAQFTVDYGLYLMQDTLPSFYRQRLGIDVDQSGTQSSIPFIAAFVVMNIAGVAADKMKKWGWLSTVNIRRLMMMIAAISLSAFAIGAGFVECHNTVLATVLLSAGLGLAATQFAGHVMSYTDIAPAYTGVISSVANTISCISGPLGTWIVGWVAPNKTQLEWLNVFYISAGINMFGALVFCIFIQGHPQSWAVAEVEPELSTRSTTTTSEHPPEGSDTYSAEM
ncbi:Major Facilitator Superfamily protein [Aphelenchoides avenae]|nr:Major Facilitator Superfamily protein [Aphelenchus avenae]